MKYKILCGVLIILPFIFWNCNEDSKIPKVENTGKLQFGFRMPGENGFKRTDTNSCKLLDVGAQLQYFGVGKTRLKDKSLAQDYNWVELFSYKNPQDLEFSFYKDRQEIVLNLDTGAYVSTKIIQNMQITWMLETPNGDTILAIDYNNTSCERSQETRGFFIEYLDSTGMFTQKNNSILRCTNNGTEGLGEFEIRAGKTTKVIMRNNISGMDWIDVDGSGDWTEGDKLDNWTTYDGSGLMMKYEIEYVD